MTKKEILTKAIDKAIAGWWTIFDSDDRYELHNDGKALDVRRKGKLYIYTQNDIIFNHDFAKALWGENLNIDSARYVREDQLREMVIANNPIKYLGEHI